MNMMDAVIVAMFLAIAGVGFFVGVVRTSSSMVALYLATVIAATFYERLGNLFRGVLDAMSVGAAHFIAFVILFVGITAMFSYLIETTLHPTSTKRRFAILDNLGGASLSIVIAFVAITMSLAITVILIQAAIAASGDASSGPMSVVRSQMDVSVLAPLFLRLLPILTAAVRPWFPGGLPPILTEAGDV
ncbi:hypothetical protein BH23CHL2_BH23CHL2_19100 [soil metagenome]